VKHGAAVERDLQLLRQKFRYALGSRDTTVALTMVELHVTHVVGARPNFMKMAPVYFALNAVKGIVQRVVHTGQHYDARMSDVFFVELGLPAPDANLEVGSGSHAVQTAQVMQRFEQEVLNHHTDWVCLYGDVNSTVAAALVASKLGIGVAHVEAGLRSKDWSMPEEINRVVTDRLSQLLFTPSADADLNLKHEGVPSERIHFVGNCMIDTLVRLLPKATRPASLPQTIADGEFVLVTLHRPATVDDPVLLGQVLRALGYCLERAPIVFPLHPRTRAKLEAAGYVAPPRLLLIDPVGYLDFLWLEAHARVVVTDSGGVQEETSYLGVPCLTFRDNTERPVTCEFGSNRLIGRDPAQLLQFVLAAFSEPAGPKRTPPLWDGRAGERIAAVFAARALAKAST
jgi:UDP-N-acetylglucosamine 2-epimerase (non-hydrolysing)